MRVPQEVLNEIYDLFIDLDADEDSAGFSGAVYRSPRRARRRTDLAKPGENLQPLFETIVKTIPQATGDAEAVRCRFWSRISTTPTTSAASPSPRVSTARCTPAMKLASRKRDGSLQKTQDHQAVYVLAG